jgi:hypothetical protein
MASIKLQAPVRFGLAFTPVVELPKSKKKTVEYVVHAQVNGEVDFYVEVGQPILVAQTSGWTGADGYVVVELLEVHSGIIVPRALATDRAAFIYL